MRGLTFGNSSAVARRVAPVYGFNSRWYVRRPLPHRLRFGAEFSKPIGWSTMLLGVNVISQELIIQENRGDKGHLLPPTYPQLLIQNYQE